METLRRKISFGDGTEKTILLYKVLGKYGTHGSEIFFLFEKPEVRKTMKCIVGKGNYDLGNNLRYATIERVEIYHIREDGFIYVNRA